ncbi:uncharacterized protein LOC114575460, partial [Exaiptasia diaphana]|uniref:Uncharacterized protein n=1 Tax=Exaiptasia diaphana TaxID=2652724 RepID=A0A913YL23_EXADI
MTTGYLRCNGMYVAEQRVGQSLSRVAPAHFESRKNRAEQMKNPIPYCAEYFGHKMHVDQNEKLSMYGVTHVCAIDGYSGKIISHTLMPIKNNLAIYEDVFRNPVLSYGLWDQLRVDQGREFCLMLFVQDMLSKYRRNTDRLPYMQTTSKE